MPSAWLKCEHVIQCQRATFAWQMLFSGQSFDQRSCILYGEDFFSRSNHVAFREGRRGNAILIDRVPNFFHWFLFSVSLSFSLFWLHNTRRHLVSFSCAYMYIFTISLSDHPALFVFNTAPFAQSLLSCHFEREFYQWHRQTKTSIHEGLMGGRT